ncbi:OmpH family outer membrane protein [Pontibacter amylolyticus]|uniref:OmpH family outer membrane protein n=1 Tax=Pontibacter amylolyticus TaxID=1424080 RepID=A0ABQ1W7G8_9BACT|nr:OmpH family outer membrane protein [Pontibacter amylolyticus]GGG19007.1 hypothetical protein GCM10011323_23930 [Pontibacter amylolyticus]
MKITGLQSLERYSLLVLLLWQFVSVEAKAQADQSKSKNKVERVAYVDHGRLRKDCEAMQAVKARSNAKWKSAEQDYKRKLANLQAKDEVGRQMLDKNQQELLRRLHEERLAALQAQERRIVEAIGAVASEGGFTDVLPIEKNSLPAGSRDITEQVLRKLN